MCCHRNLDNDLIYLNEQFDHEHKIKQSSKKPAHYHNMAVRPVIHILLCQVKVKKKTKTYIILNLDMEWVYIWYKYLSRYKKKIDYHYVRISLKFRINEDFLYWEYITVHIFGKTFRKCGSWILFNFVHNLAFVMLLF